MRTIRIIPVKTKLIREGDNAVKIIIDSIPVKLRNKDVLVVATKPLLNACSRTVDFSSINLKVSAPAKKLAEKYRLNPILSELILRFSNGVYGGSAGYVLANINGIILPNGGIDRKNVGKHRYALPYLFIREKAKEIHDHTWRRFRVRVGVIISDSTLYPLRLGTRAVAVVVYGFIPVVKYADNMDLYGEQIEVTYLNIADEIASAAHLVMGEGRELVPAAIIRGLNIKLVDRYTCEMAKLDPKQCIFNKLYNTD